MSDFLLFLNTKCICLKQFFATLLFFFMPFASEQLVRKTTEWHINKNSAGISLRKLNKAVKHGSLFEWRASYVLI